MLLSARVCCQCFHGIVVLVLLMFATIALATTADILYCLFPLCLMILYDMIVVGDVRTPPYCMVRHGWAAYTYSYNDAPCLVYNQALRISDRVGATTRRTWP